MLQIIRKLLQKIIDDIDSGNSNMTEEEELAVIDSLKQYTRKDNRWSKLELIWKARLLLMCLVTR